VTPDTILNWIHAGQIKAQRTAGGQFRILIGDLRTFMMERGMDTALLEVEQGVRPYCWEQHRQDRSRFGCAGPDVCDTCLTRRAAALNCWELHGLLPVTRRGHDTCEECHYYRRWCSTPGAANDA
jgi:hypothetical protein